MRRHQHYTEHREMPILSNSSHLCLFQLSSSGYKVDSSITEATTKYPTLTTRPDLPPFMGLVNQLSTSSHTLAALLTPLRTLLSTNNELLWSSHHQEAFTNTKTSPNHFTTAVFLQCNQANKVKHRCQWTRHWVHSANNRQEMNGSLFR